MKSTITLIKGARLIVEHCMTVKTDDKVLIIADDEHMPEAQSIAGVAFSLGAYPVIANVTHHVTAALASCDISSAGEYPFHFLWQFKIIL